MATMKQSGIRIVIDSTLIIAVASMAFWVGAQSERINNLDKAINTRGAPQISIEAATRLTSVEARVDALEDKTKSK